MKNARLKDEMNVLSVGYSVRGTGRDVELAGEPTKLASRSSIIYFSLRLSIHKRTYLRSIQRRERSAEKPCQSENTYPG